MTKTIHGTGIYAAPERLIPTPSEVFISRLGESHGMVLWSRPFFPEESPGGCWDGGDLG